MKKFFFLFLLLIPSVVGVSVVPAKRIIDFEPNLETTFSFRVSGAGSIETSFEGSDLADYVTIEDSNQGSGARSVKVKLDLPSKMEKQGKNYGYFVASEVNDLGGVGGVAAIRAPIVVVVPYEGLYAEIILKPEHVNEGETSNVELEVNNLGTEKIVDAYATISVYSGDQKVGTVETNRITLEPKEDGTVYASINTNGMKPGTYRMVAEFNYGKIATIENEFRIGTLDMDIVDFTNRVRAGEISKFEVEVESKWNNEIKGVYAEITINGTTVKTPSYDVLPWERKTFETYVDIRDMPVGSYPVDVVLRYSDKTDQEQGILTVAELEQEQVSMETPKQRSDLMPVVMLGILICILVGIVVIILKKK